MPANTLLTSSPIVRLAEDVEDKIYNFRPSDTPLVSSIESESIDAVNHEWTADVFRTPNAANAAAEGADAVFTAQTQPVGYANRTQIFQDTISVSGTAERVKKYGRKSETARLKTKKMIELKKDQEAAMIADAVSVAAAGATAGRLRGLYGWIATNRSFGVGGAVPDPVNNVAPTAGTLRPLTEALVQAAILGAYTQGGDASVIMCSPAHKIKISSFTGNVQRTNEVADGKTSANVKLQTAFTIYGHDFGESKVLPNRVMAGALPGLQSTLYVIDFDKLKRGTLRGMQSQKLAVIGDSEQTQILTEVTLIVPQESTLAAVGDLTVSGN